MRPLTLPQWLAELRRRGVQVRLHGGRVRVSGLRRLSVPERAALVASGAQVQALLEARARRRPKHAKQEQQLVAEPKQRRVIGQIVNPGGALRLLFEDETKPIPARGARFVGVPYGWRIWRQ